MELKGEFSRDKIINVNNADDLKNYQIKVNSLEAKDNEIRVVFVVNKLNEGWDVLNLFDIVRLYDIRREKTTVQEAQLIGRGARYFPFVDVERADESKEKRKYDQETNHSLRILEELHYHCSHNPKYIYEIKSALQKTGMMDEPKKESIRVKDSFKKTAFYREGYIYVNRQVENKNEDKHLLKDYGVGVEYNYPLILSAFATEESDLTDKQILPGTRILPSEKFLLNDLVVLRRAADGIDFFTFDSIKNYLPSLDSMDDLFENMASILVSVKGDKATIKDLSRSRKKDIYHYVLTEIEKHVRGNSSEFKGTKEFKRCKVQSVIKDKNVYINNVKQLAVLEKEGTFEGEWYVYEKNLINECEKNLVQYIGSKADEIKEKYDEFYLVRNEKLVKLFSFADGRGFEPDFLLFAIKGDSMKESVIYQLFMEPKGEHIEEYDAWKDKFLREIKQDDRAKNLYESTEYRIVGLPFYTESGKYDFYKIFEEELGIEQQG